MVLRFDWTEEDRDGYESMLNYLVRKRRSGVIDEHLDGVKDFYLVPLMVDQEVPHQLLPLSGPGIMCTQYYVHTPYSILRTTPTGYGLGIVVCYLLTSPFRARHVCVYNVHLYIIEGSFQCLLR